MDSEPIATDAQRTASAENMHSRASRIITVKHRSVFYPLVILFVFANIVHFFAACTLLGLVLVWLLLIFAHHRNPTLLGPGLGSKAKRAADRIRAFPPELLQILSIVYITVASELPFPPEGTWLHERWLSILYTLALVLGAALDQVGSTRPRRHRGLRQWLKAKFSRTSEPEMEDEELREVSMVTPEGPIELDSSDIINIMTAEEEAWHEAQQLRWTTWIAEETERFRGDLH